MDIKCRKSICEYNKGGVCFANNVEISRCADCETYVRAPNKVEKDYSAYMFEAAPDYEPFRHIKNIKLKCEAGACLFNKSGDCVANGITVLDSGTEGTCATFIKKMKK